MSTDHHGCMQRKPWEVPFLAESREVVGLRRVVRMHLGFWGLSEVIAPAQICVSELVANVIRHVGRGTPTTLMVSMRGTHVRIEVRDPETRALPTLIAAESDAESGRGMMLVDELADRWGVLLGADSKIVWCELATTLTSPFGHTESPQVTRAEALLASRGVGHPIDSKSSHPFSVVMVEQTVIEVIADLFHWLRAHGCDFEDILDRAQARFEVALDEAS
ncbi:MULTISPECIES: ATP-binding protein [unclassified Streptomyces]|uniref:ATP-binding protein n=1 Tax=unclassified Streptomyces TaxID=2593676 RepID=UPI001F2B1A49|nr:MULTISPECIES: ATP-binding protein [unclassified Streptomyces]